MKFKEGDTIQYLGGSLTLDKMGCRISEIFEVRKIMGVGSAFTGIITNQGSTPMLYDEKGIATGYCRYFTLFELSDFEFPPRIDIKIPHIPDTGGNSVGTLSLHHGLPGVVVMEVDKLHSWLTRENTDAPEQCSHSLETYHGFSESYKYCTKCDHKEAL